MRKTLFLFAVVMGTLLGCGAETDLRGPGGGGDNGGLSDEEYNRLFELNLLQNDNSLARKSAYDHQIEPALSEKVTKLVKLMSDNCTGDRELPDEEMGGTVNDQVISGAQCPVSWIRNRTYSSSAHSFYFNDNFEARTREFISLSPITRRHLEGSITAVTNGGTKTISGTINIKQFNLEGKGVIRGAIALQSAYSGTRGSGTLHLNLTINGRYQHSAAISWEMPRYNPKYSIDGKEVELKVFEDLFSAFELTKIMANSLKMR